MSDMAVKYEDWLRGCVGHDGRKGKVYLPCDTVLEIADWIEARRDAAPVRHGHWVFNQDEMSLHCSYCDEVFRFDGAEKDECLDFMEYAKYCLACGTKMDGDDSDQK